MSAKKNLLVCFCLSIAIFIISGCSLTYTVNDSTPTSLLYSGNDENKVSLKFVDQREGEDKILSTGRIKVCVKNMEDEILFMRNNLITELNSRGIKAVYSGEEPADIVFNVKKFKIRNHRSTGFSPFQTATTCSADMIRNGKTKKIAFYFRIGKVPIWSMKEVEGPCYNTPVSIMIKELASKINCIYYGFQVPSEKVDELVNEINNNYVEDVTSLKVLELGYTNNPAAIKPLIDLTKHEDDYMRVAAICALGMLDAVEHFDLLKQIYEETKEDEKLMALKSIGDLDTEESEKFITSVRYSPDYGHHRIKEVVDLYMR